MNGTGTTMKKREPQKPVAWASSKDYRKNQLMSAAQYDNCQEKNRVEFDIPLVPMALLDAALADVERLNNDRIGLMIAQTEIGDALLKLLDLLPDPHLDKDKVQAHFVRHARQVLDAYPA